MAIFKNGSQITSLEDWELRAGPKSASQWVDGRSAKEVARAWLDGHGRLPSEVAAALANHSDFGEVMSWKAEPEAKLPFDNFPGEPRNSDLAVHAIDENGKYLIAVEAKADESFDQLISKTMMDALDRYASNPRSNGVQRINQLVKALMGSESLDDPEISGLRYQLLTACAGALCEAQRRGYVRALVLIHEFVTNKTSDEKHRLNNGDLDAFLQKVSHGSISQLRAGEICGPISVPGTPLQFGAVRLFVGKVQRNLRL